MNWSSSGQVHTSDVKLMLERTRTHQSNTVIKH
jgi:hypothetical protein